MGTGESDSRAVKRWGTYEGFVTQRLDPEGLGRVKVQVPGILVPESDWIRPKATFGGSKNRGIWAIPKVGANIDVEFNHGNPEYPRYVAGPWGRPANVSDVPDQAPQGNPDIVVIRFGDFAIVIDETVGVEKATLLDVTNGSVLRFDLVTGNVELTASKDLAIEATAGKCTIDVKGGDVVVNVTAGDAKVTASGKVELEAPAINLGLGATSGVVLALIQTWLENHKHLGVQAGGGISGVPSPDPLAPMPIPPTNFSTTVKAKA